MLHGFVIHLARAPNVVWSAVPFFSRAVLAAGIYLNIPKGDLYMHDVNEEVRESTYCECFKWLKKRTIISVYLRSNFQNKRRLSRENQSYKFM